ncbi:VENN motif pre-toxin domain-containing protein [Pantoea ananatis]|uniref:VENN motif pre-toxin domain-containing protein n=1 Tax=Pantoea ananas TaxID=553 RepID=UPI00235F7E43|nr:VENN motif pre-toxin domain-containing protein [Pantoea ananatis]
MLDKAHEKDPNVDNSRQAVVSKAWQLAYDQAIVRQGADMGGSVRTGVNAVVNALQALAGGDIRAALAQGAAPYLAAKVKELTTGNAPYGELTDTQKLNNLMAHALLGGVVAELSGGSAAAGATGAVTGELATPAIALALYGTADSDKLSPEQKANLSALATLASGIAAGVSSGSTAGAATGALAGKNAVENNALSVQQNQERAKEMTQCQGDACSAVIEKYKKINAEQHDSVVNCSGAQDCVDKANEVGKLQADYASRTSELLEKARAEGGLSPAEQDELSVLQVTTIQLEADRNAAIHNALMSGDSAEAKQLAINSLAQVAGTSAAGIAAGIGKNKTNSGENAAKNGLKNVPETQASVDNKLTNYLLAKDHPVGGSKAEWFDKALGFNKGNSSELAKQIVFEPSKAVKTAETQHGVKYDQVISITGANGRTIDVKFGWIKNNDGVVRLVTAIPAKK